VFPRKTYAAVIVSTLPLVLVYYGQIKADDGTGTLPLITSSEYGRFHALRDDDEIRFSVSYDNLPQKLERITLQTFTEGDEEILVTICADTSEPSVTENACPAYPAVFDGVITPDSLIPYLDNDAVRHFENLGSAVEKQLVILNLEIKKRAQ
jgi:hypothetical protein